MGNEYNGRPFMQGSQLGTNRFIDAVLQQGIANIFYHHRTS
jgi:hypothetical protein